jgi:hypothetical protein
VVLPDLPRLLAISAATTKVFCTALSGKSFATWSITLAKSLGHIYKMFNTIGTGNTLPTEYVVT